MTYSLVSAQGRRSYSSCTAGAASEKPCSCEDGAEQSGVPFGECAWAGDPIDHAVVGELVEDKMPKVFRDMSGEPEE